MKSPEDTDFRQIAVVSDAGARTLQGKVHALREHWIPRAGGLPFFTLGAAAFLDGPQGESRYARRWKFGNRMLQQSFGDLYACIGNRLGEAIGAVVEWHPAAALPGFQIYRMHRAFYGRGGSIHLDLQYEHVDWSAVGIPDFDSVISFTLPIALPSAGSGLRWWEGIEPAAWSAASKAERQQIVREAPMHYLPYRVGAMIVHSGRVVHQIAPGQMLESHEERITLQGHGVRVGERYVCYW